ncbi:phosphotyrosine-specific ptp2-like protein, partial [Linderina macrospora]
MDPNVEHTVDSSTTATDNSQQQEGFNPIDQPPRPSGINTGFALTFASAPSYHESSYETPQEQTESPSGPFRLSSASSAGSGSSFGQRMRARKPNGLKLNLSGPSSAESSGAWDQTPKTGQQMAFGSGGEMARRQHHSTWSAKTPATPAPIGFRRAGYQQNRYVTLNGVGQDPVSAGSDVATPKDLSGTINSLRKDLVTRNLGTSGLRVNAAMAFDDDGMAPPTPTIASSSATETVLGNRDQMAMGTPSLQLPPVTPFTLAGLSSDLLLQRHQQNKQQWGSLRPAQTLAGEQVTGLSFIEPGEFAEKMARDECGLVVDVRKAAQHTQSRVSTAVSMAVPTTLLKRKSSTVEQISGILMLSDEQKARLAGWKTGPWVVLYGDGTAEETASEDSPLVMLARKFMSEAGDACSVLVLRGGFDGYSKIYQDSCETGCGQISSPVIDLSNTSHIAHDHPLLRKMRQTPGGGFNPTEIVSMRLPPDFSASNQASPTKSQLQKLPEYLRRAADPQTGAQLLFKLFKKVDASEARRMSSMITNNGMVTNENRFTISAGLELGSKNRYTNIWPFDGNRVKLRSSGRKSHQQPNETPGLPPEMQHLMQKRPATTTAGNTLAARLTSYMAAKSSSEAESAKSRSSAAASASSSQSPPQLNVDLASVPASKKLNSKLKLSSVRPQSISTLMTPRATDNSNNKLWQVDEGTTKRSSFRVESKSKPMMASSLDSDSV